MAERDEGEINKDKIPEYTPVLADFHRAFEGELRAIVATIPLPRVGKVLDFGCGDGFYSQIFAERLGPRGSVTGMDANRALLKLAQKKRPAGLAAKLKFIAGDVDDLQQIKAQFDVVWCAQSLFSLVDTDKVLKAMKGALKPGGLLAVFENDSLHQLLFPWPATLEIEIRAAEIKVLRRKENFRRFYVGRRLPELLAGAGFKSIYLRSQAIDRRSPLGRPLNNFLRHYFSDLLTRTGKHLSPGARSLLKSLTNAKKKSYVIHSPHFNLTWINFLAWGRK